MTKFPGSRALLAGILGGMLSAPAALPAFAADGASVIAEGKTIAFDRKKGNCLACHMIEDGASPGNLGPPLIAMKLRYPDKAKLRAQIYDPLSFNPDSAMVPFGKMKVLTDDEIDKVVEYIWSI